MTNLVIDTNVFVHSCNPNNAYFDKASELIEKISISQCVLCVDEGLDVSEAQNRSSIWAEYTRHIPQASVALELLAHLLINARVVDFPRKTNQNVHSTIRGKVNDPTDIVFVKISFNSNSIALVSHDFAAFPEQTRTDLRTSNIANTVDCYGIPNF